MAGNRKLTIEILGDAKDATKAFGQVEGSADGFGKKMGGAAKVAGVAMLGIAGGALAMIPGLLEGGAELDALAKKAETVFGDSLGMVQAWGKENAGAMGLTVSEATGAAAAIGDLLKPMGFTSEAAADMSLKMLDLSGALSAWTGGTKSATEVSEIITKAMLGETDGLKALGISISAADIKARLAAKGQDQLTGAALEQAEALAIQELIMEKSTDAQDAWNNGSMDGIKAQNESKASIEQMKESLTTALYPALQAIVPIVTEVATWLGEHLPGAIAVVKEFIETKLIPVFKAIGDVIGEVVGWVQEHWDEISAIVGGAIGYIRGAIQTGIDFITNAWDIFGGSLVGGIKGAWALIKGVVQAAIDIVRGIINVVMGLIRGDWDQVWEGIKGIVSGVWDAIKAIVQGALDAVKLAISLAWDLVKLNFEVTWAAIKAVVQAVWDGIKSLIQGAIDVIKSALSSAWDGIKSVASTAWEGIKSAVMAPIDALKGALSAAWDAIKGAVSVAWDGIKLAITSPINVAKDVIAGIWDTIVGAVKGLPGRIASAASGMWNSIKDGFRSAINTVIGWWNNLSFSLPGVDIGPFSTPSFTLSTPNIPTLHSGGIVPGQSNQEVLALVKGGEAVFTEDQQKALGGIGGGFTFINYAPIMSKQDIARELYDMIVDGQRRGELVGSLA